MAIGRVDDLQIRGEVKPRCQRGVVEELHAILRAEPQRLQERQVARLEVIVADA